MEHSLQLNSVKYLLTFLLCKYSMFRIFLPSELTMLLIVAISLAKTNQLFFSPQRFISIMSKYSFLQFSSNVNLSHPLCLCGVWELLPCMEAIVELQVGGCSCVHTSHFQVLNCSCEKRSCFILSCSSVGTEFRLLLSSSQGFFF